MANRTNVELVEIVPESLKQDPQISSMAEAIQPQLNHIAAAIPGIQIYKNIDLLPEPILRLLAVENRVYKYEWQLAQTLEAKRDLIKNSFELNQRRGTRWSVERVFELLDITAVLQEWFEYDGNPYRFKVSIYDIAGRPLTEPELENLYRLIDYYKPLRSSLESVDVILQTDEPATGYFGAINEMAAVLEAYGPSGQVEYDFLISEEGFIVIDDDGSKIIV